VNAGLRRRPLGEAGERLALALLKRQGLKILATNYRCPAGEIDLIALDTSLRGRGPEATAAAQTTGTPATLPAQADCGSDQRRPLPRILTNLLGAVRRLAGWLFEPADRSPGVLVFVEVKTRSSDRYTRPESAVDADKQKRIRRAASYYRRTTPAARGLDCRFDIVSIVLPEGGSPQITHLPDAFT
jgi:Holliday junction resolvase-like predicted endonuclease